MKRTQMTSKTLSYFRARGKVNGQNKRRNEVELAPDDQYKTTDVSIFFKAKITRWAPEFVVLAPHYGRVNIMRTAYNNTYFSIVVYL